jgi:hypothetical protein
VRITKGTGERRARSRCESRALNRKALLTNAFRMQSREFAVATSGERYHRPVSHTSPTETEVEPDPENHRRGWTSSRLATWVPAVIAVIAAGLAIAAWLRPTHPGPQYPQSGDAKTNLCDAYKIVHQGVVTNTHLTSPNPNDEGSHFAIAANARLSLLGGGAYLRDTLDAQTAPPGDLAKATNAMAATIEQLGVNYLADATDEQQQPLRKDLDSEIKTMNKLCQ